MLAAMDAVKYGDSIQEASADFQNRHLGSISADEQTMEVTVAQIRSFLSDDKKKLAAYLIDVSKQGYGKRKQIILYEWPHR